jgi:thymidylate synthase
VQWLQERGVSIWDEWADEEGDLGHIYGYQWRHWPVYDHKTVAEYGRQCFANGGIDGNGHLPKLNPTYIDQIADLLDGLRNNPTGRRHVVSAWNVGDLPNMRLPPCHMFFQCYVRQNGKGQFLDLQMYQRSADWFLGVPFNIASYALLTMLLAHHSRMIPGRLIMDFGDAHIYTNHLEQATTQLLRTPDESQFPQMEIRHHNWFNDYSLEDFVLTGYKPQPAIWAPISV